MSRPKKLPEDAKNVSLYISASEWNQLNARAKSMGLSRVDLISKISRGEIPLGEPMKSQDGQVLGKY